MEPPAKKLRPYVTKWERRQKAAAEKKLLIENENERETLEESDLKELFLTNETVLEYQDKFHKNNLPRVVHTLQHEANTRHCDWSRTSRQLATCSYDQKVQAFDFLSQGKVTCTLEIPETPSCLQWWRDDENMILVGGENSFLASYDLRTGKEASRYRFKCGKILSFDFFINNTSFMSSCDQVNRQSAEHNLIVWDVRTAAKISNQIFHERYTCPHLRVHPSGTNILAQTTGNYIARFSTQKPFRLDKFVRYQNHTVNEYPVGFDISRDGQFVVSGSSNGSVVCYKHNNGNYMRTISLSVTNESDSCVDVQCHPVMPSMVAISNWAGNVYIIS
ncbi:WD repeat-containing protein 25-like isoform X2 [Clavelina lepadiformis]|uniref:WD repeat-containing protein 25-like isoform X2 n=1 Tax=Clavelina lepadiformis TaxID=159417 RepID=UPI0040426E50